MKGSEYFKKLQKVLTQETINKAVLSAALTVNSEAGERIFQNGLNSEGSEIGKYDTKEPLYVNPKNAPKKFPPKGKYGDTKFEDGKPHKTGYFDSYTAFRQKVGRPTGKVNLVMFGVLQSDFVKGPKKTSTGAVITLTEENNNKRLGAESRFENPIFALTQEEKETYFNLVSEQITKKIHAV